MRVAIIGTGYVGLVTGVCLAEKGHQVICVDKKPEIVATINAQRSPLYEPGLEELMQRAVCSGQLRATANLKEAVMESELSIIAVGTPFGHEEIDLDYVKAAAWEVGAAIKEKDEYHLICVKSTVVPGTTDTVVKRVVAEASGKEAGDFGLAMNPEFLREGSAVSDFMNPDRIIIGAHDRRSFLTMEAVYAGLFSAPILNVNLRTAEMIKYSANALLASLISFANEIAGICEAAGGVDVKEVLEAVTLDKRFNPRIAGVLVHPGMNTYLRAGCGFGGSCFPKDIKALIAFSRENGFEPRMIDAAIRVNNALPLRVVDRVEANLGTLVNKKIAVLGLAFKPGTDDVRESPALPIIKELLLRQALVVGADPVAVERMEKALPQEPGKLAYTTDYQTALTDAYGAVLVTPWPQFKAIPYRDYSRLMRYPLILDCRRVLDRGRLMEEGGVYLGTGLVEGGGEGG